MVNDAAANRRSCVAAECAVGDNRVGAVTVHARALVSRITANCAVDDVQRSGIEDAAAETCCVTAERAADNGQDRGAAVEDATAEPGVTISDCEARYGDGFTGVDLEHRAHGIAVHGQHVTSGAVDCHTLTDDQFPSSECNHAGDTRGINRIAIVRVRERLTQ